MRRLICMRRNSCNWTGMDRISYSVTWMSPCVNKRTACLLWKSGRNGSKPVAGENGENKKSFVMIIKVIWFFAGYYVYMRERRDQLRSMYPEMPFYEIIRQLAQEWNNMDREVKQVSLNSVEFVCSLFCTLLWIVITHSHIWWESKEMKCLKLLHSSSSSWQWR